MEFLMYTAAAYNAAFAVFHLAFWRLFGWKKDLGRLSAINRGVMQVLNICLTLLFVAGALAFLLLPTPLISEISGRGILYFFALFWFVRLVLQPFFFGNSGASLVFSVLFALGAMIHGWMAYWASIP